MRLARRFVIMLGIIVVVPPASAADCPPGQNCPGKRSTPVFDSLYIRKFCGPTINPGTCHGFYQNQWKPWDASCPGGNCGVPAAVTAETPAPTAATIPPATPPAATPPKPAVPDTLPKLPTLPSTLPPVEPDKKPGRLSAAPQPMPHFRHESTIIVPVVPVVEVQYPAAPPTVALQPVPGK